MIISESNINDMKYEIEQSIEEFGLIETLKRYKFPFKLANIMFQLTRPFTNEECNEILSYYLFEKEVLPNIYQDKDVFIGVEKDSMVGAWHFSIEFKKTKEAMGGYGTMFWDGSDVLPINVDIYSNKIRNYDSDVELFYPVDINFEFYKISELLDWFNSNYYDSIIDTCTDWLEECRLEMFEWLSENDPDYID
jgi:hypothetical protein